MLTWGLAAQLSIFESMQADRMPVSHPVTPSPSHEGHLWADKVYTRNAWQIVFLAGNDFDPGLWG
jgi:hypothetical protein